MARKVIRDIGDLPRADKALGRGALKLGDIRLDGWMNTLTGIGDPSRDKRTAGFAIPMRLSYIDQTNMYEASDVAANICDTPAEDMTREGWELTVGDEGAEQTGEGGKGAASDKGEMLAEDVKGDLDLLDIDGKIHDCIRYSRSYGGASIVVGFDDGRQPWEPVNEDAIKGLLFLTVLNRYEIVPIQYYADPFQPKFAEPELYLVSAALAAGEGGNVLWELQSAFSSGKPPEIEALKQRAKAALLLDPKNQFIHESRVLRFNGIRINRQRDRENSGWGLSIFNRCHSALRDFDISFQAAAALVSDFAQAVWGVKGLAALVASNNTEAFANRLKGMDLARSVLRAVAIDSDETFERKATPLTGLPEILDRIAQRMASAARMPLTKLLGISPAGMNATGESDIRQWYDYCAAQQKKVILPQLNRVVRAALISRAGTEPDAWKVKMNPLRQMSDAENALMRFQVAQADALYLTNGVLTPEEVARSRYGGSEFSMDVTLDLDARDAMAEAEEEMREAQLSALATASLPAGAAPTKAGPGGTGKNGSNGTVAPRPGPAAPGTPT